MGTCVLVPVQLREASKLRDVKAAVNVVALTRKLKPGETEIKTRLRYEYVAPSGSAHTRDKTVK